MFPGLTRFLRISYLFVCICICLHIFSTHTVQAASEPIRITSQNTILSFPKSIDFEMSASASTIPITHATIYLKYNTGSYLEQHDIDIKKPELSVSLNWQQNTSGYYYSPPGTLITYYWRVIDKTGYALNGDPQTLLVTDTRFKWQERAEGLIHVEWYDQDADFGGMLLERVKNHLKHIQNTLGGGLHIPITLWVYQKNEDFHSSLPPKANEWVGGIAFPGLNQASIVANSDNDTTLLRDLPHELTHLVFHQLTAVRTDAPLWFDEGLAVYNQSYHEPEMTRIFKNALTKRSLLRLEDITLNFPKGSDEAYLAYAQSWKLVDYMYSSFGLQKMEHLIQDIHDTNKTWNDDLDKDLGIDEDHLENQWRLSLSQPAILRPEQLTPKLELHPTQQLIAPITSDPMAPVLLTLGIFLVLLPFLSAGGFLLYRQHNHRQAALTEQINLILTTSATKASDDNSTMQDSSFGSLHDASGNSWSGNNDRTYP